jgi:hypothetical protein
VIGIVLLPAGGIATADRGLVERILAQSGVERVPVPPQASYLSALSQALGRWLAELIRRGGEALRLGPETQAWIAATLVVLAVAALAWVLVAVLRRVRRRQTAAAGSAPASAPAPADTVRDAEAWRAELELLLSQGAGAWSEEQTGAALRAAWWWLARAIAGPEAAADWTSRDLAARSRRRELRDALRRLDALTFGADRPCLADLRGLAEQIRLSLRGALG